jgi:hypothetical protein
MIERQRLVGVVGLKAALQLPQVSVDSRLLRNCCIIIIAGVVLVELSIATRATRNLIGSCDDFIEPAPLPPANVAMFDERWSALHVEVVEEEEEEVGLVQSGHLVPVAAIGRLIAQAWRREGG